MGTPTPDGEIIPKVAVKLDSMLAPRIGFIYDPTQEGRSKIFGHWGRFYEDMPMDINVRAFGGEIQVENLINGSHTRPGTPGYDPNCNVDHGTANPVGTLGMCSDTVPITILGQGTEYVTPGLSGQYTDELILGTEYELLPDFKVGLSYVHRSLPSVIEDISTDGGNTYFITNPGKNFDAQAATLEKQAMQLMASSDPGDQALGALYDYRAKQMEYIKTFDKPVRNYDALQLTLQNRPTKHALIMASYTYSMEKGNYPGLFSTETGQLNPNLTSLYDLPDLMANRYGFMGLDRPHNFKVDGFYAFDLKKAGQLTAGASFRAQSGIAHNALGAHPTYGSGESYLLPRGAEPRSPVTSELDVKVQYGYQLSKTTQLTAFVDIFNLFNQQDQLNVDENYTYDYAVPVVGGTPDDLKHIKAHDGNGYETNQSLTPNPNFLHTGGSNGLITSVQQAPRTIRFGVRLTF